MPKRAHFIGLGGVGMSGVAKLLQDAGVRVTGSDEAVYPPVSDFLKEQKFEIKTPYAATNIPQDADLIVIGKNAKLVAETNPEVAAAYVSGKKIVSFPEVLADLSRGKETLVVAGSYGKSSVTALLAHCLLSTGKDPSFFIGAIPMTPSASSAIGRGNLFILEGDEYPSSNTDLRAKFLHYKPQHLLITPLAHDHFNVFKTPRDYLKPFFELMELLPAHGTVLVCTEGPLSKEFLSNLRRKVITYGLHEGEFHAGGVMWNETTSFDFMRGDVKLARIATRELGEHNIQNIVGAAALLFSLELLSPAEFVAGVSSFKGIKRRLDRKSQTTSIPVFEGFGSSYEKARAAIVAMKQHFKDKRLFVIFEPNTFSWRNKAALAQYDTAFLGAHKVHLFEPPHDGKETQLSLDEIKTRIEQGGTHVSTASTPEHVLSEITEELREGDVVLLLSSGALGGLPESLPRLLEQLFPKKV